MRRRLVDPGFDAVQLLSRAAAVKQRLARVPGRTVPFVPATPSDRRDRFEDHPVAEERRDVGVVVRWRPLDEVQPQFRELVKNPPDGVEQLPGRETAGLGRACSWSMTRI